MPDTTSVIHEPITLLVGTADCFERECEEYVTEDGENDPGVERCSHIAEQTVCGACSTEGEEGEYDTVVPWAGPHDACPCGQPIPAGEKHVAYCSDECKRADDDHGPDEVGGDES